LTAISVTLSTPATASAPVIPKIVASIELPSPLTGGLVTVQEEPLSVDGVKFSVAVNAFVDVPENECVLLQVTVNEITDP